MFDIGSWFSSSKKVPEENLEKPKAINLNDPYSVKRHLDDVAIETILGRGYGEDVTISNIKLAIGVAACATALLAQFYPKKFPENQPLLVSCIVIYMLLNVVLQYVAYFKEKNHILLTHPLSGTFTQTGLAVSSTLPRYSDMYTFTIASSDPKSIAARPAVHFTKSVTQWFASDGVLAEDIFVEDVENLLDLYADDSRKTK